jgi:endo-1,4-beta-xylanase
MKPFIWIVLLLLMSLPLVAAGQEAAPPLRELAARLDKYIGTVGDPDDFNADLRFAEIAARDFNLFSPENMGKLCILQTQEDRYDFRGMDRIMDFAEANNMEIHGHVLVWHSCMPEWLLEQDLTRDQAIALMRDHIFTVVGRYAGRIAYWDVVNEAFEEDGRLRVEAPWREWIGDDYIELAFRFAHEADPTALLFYNDYNAEAVNAKSDAVYAMVQDFLARDVPIDGVGLQMHVRLGDVGPGRPVDPASVSANIARLGALGLKVQITEMDVAHQGAFTEAVAIQQAGVYYQIMQVCLDNPACLGLSTWGLTDSRTWLRMPEFFNNPEVAPLLFDEDYQPKLAYTALADVMARALGETPLLTDDEVAAMIGTNTPASMELPAPVFSTRAQLAPDSVNGLAYYVAYPVTITLDGQPDDWAAIPRDQALGGTNPPDAGDPTALQFAAAADATYFYFLGEVTDANVVFGKFDLATNWYQEDSVEFYINATGDLTRTGYAAGVAQIALPAANLESGGDSLTAGGNADTVPVEVVASRTETGYLVEARVPLVVEGVWSIVPAQGEAIGFQAHLNDSSGANRDVKLIWSQADNQDQSWRDPSVFGRAIFWQVGS